MICGPAGQPGDVSVMLIVDVTTVDGDLVDEAEVDDVEIELGVFDFAQRELDLIGSLAAVTRSQRATQTRRKRPPVLAGPSRSQWAFALRTYSKPRGVRVPGQLSSSF